MLRYTITPEGIPDKPWVPPTAPDMRHNAPVTSLPDLAEQEEDEWDTPDAAADFARLQSPEAMRQAEEEPVTADFDLLLDGTLALLRWPRLKQPAAVPESIEGHPVTAIAATAFGAAHLEESLFAQMFTSPISYSVFSMRMGRHINYEARDSGGPTSIALPTTLRHIGPYAFWHCKNLKQISLPEGITSLPVGAFGECASLEAVQLPATLQSIGYLPRPTDQVMPDVGVFAGCHALKSITLPAALQSIGAHTFNSSGLLRLIAIDAPGCGWSRAVQVAPSAFDHTAALLWLDKADPSGKVEYRLGLPVARDKILAGDARFGNILRIPADFFVKAPGYFDELAQTAFRLDFSARMALARLQYGGGLTAQAHRCYVALLVQYFDRAPQFMPQGDAYTVLFALLEACPDLTAADMSDLLRAAGTLGLPAELSAHMMEVRTLRFSSVTGFEDLEL